MPMDWSFLDNLRSLYTHSRFKVLHNPHLGRDSSHLVFFKRQFSHAYLCVTCYYTDLHFLKSNRRGGGGEFYLPRQRWSFGAFEPDFQNVPTPAPRTWRGARWLRYCSRALKRTALQSWRSSRRNLREDAYSWSHWRAHNGRPHFSNWSLDMRPILMSYFGETCTSHRYSRVSQIPVASDLTVGGGLSMSKLSMSNCQSDCGLGTPIRNCFD